MKSFWALPAILRLALASYATFTALDDIISFPQYEVGLSNSVLSESEARAKIAALSAKTSPTAAPAEVEPSLDVQQFKPNDGSPQDSRDDLSPHDESIRDYELMVWHNQRFLCSIPAVDLTADNSTVDAPSPEDVEKELARATNHGEELLRGMEGNCIFFNTGWWTYSFCYNQSVRQFHSLPPSRQVPLYPPVEDSSVQSYVLGQFQSGQKVGGGKGKEDVKVDGAKEKAGREQSTETGLAKLEQRGELKYLVQNLSGGTTCDLTGKDRRIEVQFHCVPNSHDRIALIKELATCTYLMVIHTPRLCNDVAFQPPQRDKPHRIRCAPVIPDNADQEQAQEREQQDFVEEDSPIMIGNIEFGGHRILPRSPPPDSSIEDSDVQDDLESDNTHPSGWLRDRDSLANSLILGGQREKLVATVASSHKPALSEEELKNLNVREREVSEINRFRKQMENLSKGKGWRLDIVETARGREFRGIIETDDEIVGVVDGEGDDGQRQKETGASVGGKEREDTSGGKENKEKEQDLRSSNDAHDGSEERYKEEL
ncbi:hypothetical protein NA57DRAFT_43045 [Rhizodiscina lignyota]|uniref:Endoplasmic reticulum lectin n=1 Tax=Rhizodiscina lignyota TaxID=1504668 RepID=A0A9P4IC16_9PEZI|nr:hypothetical protein NA57DRAFT_43045 [Rhizodiscina lignyota]